MTGKRQVMKWGVTLIALFCMCASMMLCAGAAEAERMPELEAGKKGTLDVIVSALNGDGKEEALEKITLELFEVGTLEVNGGSVSYVLTKDFASTAIDFTGMTAEQSNEYAARLNDSVKKGKLKGMTAITDKKGKAEFADLTPGMYLIRQKENSGQTAMYLEMPSFLVAVPEAVKAQKNEWKYEVKALPKIAIGRPIGEDDGTGSINVTKKIALLDVTGNMPLITPDRTFYVGLFTDAQGTKLYGTNYVKPIHISNASSGSETFEKLPFGTYYVFETDAKGAPVPVKTAISDGSNQYVCLFDNDQQKVEVKTAKPYENALTNAYVELPKNFYIGATIDIYKFVKKNNKQIEADETFYAGVFTKNSAGELELYKLVTLEQNDKVEVEVPLGGSGKDPIEYWVYETNEKGDRINEKTFKYKVTGEGSVKLSESNLSDKVEITNTIPDKSEDETEKNSKTGVKTGDETPIMTYVLLLAGAAAVLLLLVLVRKMRKTR